MKNLFAFIFLLSSPLSLISAFGTFPMGSNSSSPKLQVRQLEVILRGGIIFNARRSHANARTRTCTFGFAVKKIPGPKGGTGTFNQGYLTAGSCASSRGGGSDGSNAYVIAANGYEVYVGKFVGVTVYDPTSGLDYAVVKMDPDNWDDQHSMDIITNPPHTAPVVDRIYPIVGSHVCFSSFYSGYVCGTVAKLKAVIPRLSPWITRAGGYPKQDYFQNLGLVRMDPGQVPTKAQINAVESRDFGAPVFIPVPNPLDPQEILGVSPVGIFNGYAMMGMALPGVPGAEVGYNAFFFYTPIEGILANLRGLKLISSPNAN
jgi:hypothetical protein